MRRARTIASRDRSLPSAPAITAMAALFHASAALTSRRRAPLPSSPARRPGSSRSSSSGHPPAADRPTQDASQSLPRESGRHRRARRLRPDADPLAQPGRHVRLRYKRRARPRPGRGWTSRRDRPGSRDRIGGRHHARPAHRHTAGDVPRLALPGGRRRGRPGLLLRRAELQRLSRQVLLFDALGLAVFMRHRGHHGSGSGSGRCRRRSSERSPASAVACCATSCWARRPRFSARSCTRSPLCSAPRSSSPPSSWAAREPDISAARRRALLRNADARSAPWDQRADRARRAARQGTAD